MAQMISQVSGALGALNATVGPASMLNPDVTLLVTGTFTATVALQVRQNGNAAAPWLTIGTPLTAAGEVAFSHLAGDLEFQAVCTAYTSGSAAVYLAACPSS